MISSSANLPPVLRTLIFYFYCVYLCAQRGQKRVLESLELELQGAVSCLTVTLGTELGSSGRAGHTLN